MNIDMPHSDKLEFRLDSRDLSELNITFDELDYSNAQTRRVVWTLVDIARKNLHTDFDLTGGLLVEVFPEKHGGCRLCITSLPKEKQNVNIVARQVFTTYVFELSADDLLDLARQIKKLPATSDDGELFSNGDKFRLIVPLPDSQRHLKALINEYGVLKGDDEFTLSYTREHWQSVISRKALKRLRG